MALQALNQSNPVQDPTQAFLGSLLPTFKAGAEIKNTITQAAQNAQAQKQKALLAPAGEAFSALRSGNPEAAASVMDRQAAARRNSGDEQGAVMLEGLSKIAREKPAQALEQLSAMLSRVPGGSEIIDNSKKLAEDRRAQELQGFKVRKDKAEAILTELKVELSPEKLAKQGLIAPDKRPEAESKFRDEYYTRTKGYQDVKSAYGRVLASGNDAAGDLALIFSYMKMLDPGSTVREGEAASAQNAAGVSDRVRNAYNNALEGTRLSPGQRKVFKGQAEALYGSAQKQEGLVRSGIERIAKKQGLDTTNIFYEETETAPAEPAKTKRIAGAGGGEDSARLAAVQAEIARRRAVGKR